LKIKFSVVFYFLQLAGKSAEMAPNRNRIELINDHS